MPLYADLAAMQARFEERDLVQLTDVAGNGTIDEARVGQALAKADTLIRGYVASRYADAAALAGNPLLTEIACDLAFADLWRSEQPEIVKTRRKEAVQALNDIAGGKIKLDNGQDEAAPRPGQILTSGPERVFGRSTLSGY